MNRHQKRARATAMRLHAKSARREREVQGSKVLLEADVYTQLLDANRMLLAIVKEQGRVRVAVSTLQGLTPRDGLKGKGDGTFVTLSHELASGAEEPEPKPTEPDAADEPQEGSAP